MTRLHATSVRAATDGAHQLTLTYEDRFLRRKVLKCDDGTEVLVDLAQTTSLNAGDALVCEDGREIVIAAAVEPVLQITAARLLQIVWHIGNRHCPSQIEDHRVLIQPDHVLRDLMVRLGAEVTEVQETFTPEGGAYGHGRTHGHDHSHQHGPDHHHND